MHMKTIGEVSQETLKLQDYLSTQPHGTALAYSDIQRESGVAMDAKGRARLRSAMKLSRREYSCIPGVGIRLADAQGVMPILSSRIKRIDHAVVRADRSQRLLQEQFFAQLDTQDQKRILFAGAVFGAIRLAAEQGKQLQRRNHTLLPAISIPLPPMGGEVKPQ
jgi:hypothetical protein